MGKQRRIRQKLHLPAAAKSAKTLTGDEVVPSMDIVTAPGLSFKSLLNDGNNIFEGITIDIGNLNKKIPDDDVQTVKSYKSVKSELGSNKGGRILPKKDKLKLRREMFLKKIDMIGRVRAEEKLRKKRKNTAIIGDTNLLRDALPSLDSLLVKSGTVKKGTTSTEKKKLKGIEKAIKQKKNLMQGIAVYKQLFKNKTFQKDPLGTVSEHVKAALDREKMFN